MKALMILGAIVGFSIGASFGIAGRSPWPQALWHAGAAAFIAALLTRWWSRVWMNGLRESLEQRRTGRHRSQAVPPKPTAKSS